MDASRAAPAGARPRAPRGCRSTCRPCLPRAAWPHSAGRGRHVPTAGMARTGRPCRAPRPSSARASQVTRKSAARTPAGCARGRCHRCAGQRFHRSDARKERCRGRSRPCPGARTQSGSARYARERLQLRAPPYATDVPGVLALVGGNEFNPGNEEQDRRLAAAAGAGPAFVVPTAAARQQPAASVAHPIAWVTTFGLKREELPVLKRGDAASEALARRARSGGFFYLVGGDPGLVAKVLHGSVVWRAMFEAWRAGAALAGSSAGVMPRGSHTLVRATGPDHVPRRPAEALGVLSETAILP